MLRQLIVKFNLSSLAGKTITAATLRLFVKDPTSASTLPQIKRVSDDSWLENTVNYNTRPALGTFINSFNASVDEVLVTINVTVAVQEQVSPAGDGILSMGIDTTSTNGLDLSSKEATSNKPELAINYT